MTSALSSKLTTTRTERVTSRDVYNSQPPFSARSTGHLDEYQGKNFLNSLRKVFHDADDGNKGFLTIDEWQNSSIRSFLQDGKLSDEDFRKYFLRIDANADGHLTWSELIQYLIKEIAVNDLHIDSESARFIHKPNLQVPSRAQSHREMVTHIWVCNRTGEYVTQSPDSIRFWNPNDLTLRRCITEPGSFSTFCIFEQMNLIAAASTKRRLFFYELESLALLPIDISASPTTRQIKAMSIKEAEGVLDVLNSPLMPLVNVPTALCPADNMFKPRDYVIIFFVGDDAGIIEVYKLDVPLRRNGTDYIVSRIGRNKMHNGGINQIAPIDFLNCYASCSLDGSVKMWNFLDTKNDQGSFTVLRVFNDKWPVVGFTYSPSQKILITHGVSREGNVWGISPPRNLYQLGGHYNAIEAITEFITTTNEKYILTLTKKKEFRLWDSVNFRLLYEWTDPVMQRPEDHFTAAKFDYNRHALITCSSYPTKWAEDINANLELFEIRTHGYPIMGVYYSKEFDQLLSVDAICTFKLWDVMTGTLSSQRKSWEEGMSKLSSVCMDCSYRRIIASSFDCRTSLWNFNSGTEIPNVSIQAPTNFVNVMRCVTISARDYLVRACWDRHVMVFTESRKGNFELYRKFQGHKNDITDIASYFGGLISCDVDGVIITWVLDTNAPQESFKINSSAECLCVTGHYLFVGDGIGRLHLFILPKLIPVLDIDAHEISKPYILSHIAYDEANHFLYTSDTLGYVRKWSVEFEPKVKLTPLLIKRCSLEEVTSILIMCNGQIIITVGIDRKICFWKAENFDYYGFLHENSHWTLGDPESIQPEPYELEKSHFERSYDKKLGNRLNSLSSRYFSAKASLRDVVSGIDLPHAGEDLGPTPKIEEPVEETKGEEEDEHFSFLEAAKFIDDFMDEQDNKKITLPKEILQNDENMKSHFVEPEMYQSVLRPQEIITTYKSLRNRPITSNSQPKSPSVAIRNQYISSLKKPIFKPKFGQPRISSRLRLSQNIM